ncbi:MAG: hypothetical protein M1834_009627 [Cirrosporium novae-zelandiae]|nr:MAG: hypothetical protein M1834_009627 [Cirrosporium novae-zelandiae]
MSPPKGQPLVAPPLLASTLLSPELAETSTVRKKLMLTTGGNATNGLSLEMRYGDTIGVCGEDKECVRMWPLYNLLYQHLQSAPLSSSLSPIPVPHATIIDTMGSFSPISLYTYFCSRLIVPTTSKSTSTTPLDKFQEAEAMAMRMLERVNIMRTFDFWGIGEAIEEVRAEFEEGEIGMEVEVEVEKGKEKEKEKEKMGWRERGVVGDSDSDEEELDLRPESESESGSPPEIALETDSSQKAFKTPSTPPLEMIILDALTPPFTALTTEIGIVQGK